MTRPAEPLPLPAPPAVPESFACWCGRQPIPVTGWVYQAVRSLVWKHNGPRKPEDIAEFCGHVMVPLLERFVHETATWQPPTYRFIELRVKEHLRDLRKQPRQYPNGPAGDGDSDAFDGAIADHRSEAAAATADATAAVAEELDQQLDVLRAFDTTWKPKEAQVLRSMTPGPTTTWIGLHLRGWTVAQIAAWFGVEQNNVDTNWRSRGNKAFERAWIELFGEADWDAYQAARKAAADARRAIERYENERDRQERNGQGQDDQ